MRNQLQDGNLAKGDDKMMYSHGLATVALAEAYAVSGDKTLLQPVQKARYASIVATRRDKNVGAVIGPRAETQYRSNSYNY